MTIKTKKVSAKKINNVTVGGVYYRNDKKRYVARFTHNGKRINVGSFVSENKAKSALNQARRAAMTA